MYNEVSQVISSLPIFWLKLSIYISQLTQARFIP
jgi:hypothetical protein